MVSIRKKRHLGIHERYKNSSQLTRLNARQTAPESIAVVVKSTNKTEDIGMSETPIEHKPMIMPMPSPPHLEASSSKEINNTVPGSSLKSRKSSRRKQAENQDSCMLRGVYYKNMKWQAAIKVEKKQIHLGTVSSMEEAAHLYDRAAYLCGRVPNFELSEEEKQELQGLQWEEFLIMTKEAIASKKKRKRVETCMRRRRTSALGEDGEIDGHPFSQIESELPRQPVSLDDHTSFYPKAPYSVPPFYYASSFHPPGAVF